MTRGVGFSGGEGRDSPHLQATTSHYVFGIHFTIVIVVRL